jgi:hypothetical protein
MKNINRREILLASFAAGCTQLTIGCNQVDDTSNVTVARSDVPLRLLWMGNENDVASAKRKWEAIAPHPINASTISLPRSESSDVVARLIDQCKKQDIVVYPILAAAELTNANAVIPLKDELLGGVPNVVGSSPTDGQSQTLSRLYPALRNGAAQFAGRTIGLPLGANLPCILSADSVEPFDSWLDYERWVTDELGGAAAEPTTEGWAAQMFLWRAATTAPSPWLFSPEDLTPLIDQENYVVALSQMLQTFKKYKNGMQTPQSIWNGIAASTLRGGIGWQLPGEDGSYEIAVASLPSAESSNRVLLDPFSLSVSIASGCRQSAAATDFIRWISAGEGNAGLRNQIAQVTPTRFAEYDEDLTPQRSSQYDTWLRERLSKPLNYPTLQLIASDKYYSALDEQVTRCLQGKSTPKQSLTSAANTWKELHNEMGVKQQERAWRRAQGSRA